MAKTMYIDRLWVVMHFNSSPEAYFLARDPSFGPFTMECCYCHRRNPVTPPGNIGARVLGTCAQCNRAFEYMTLLVSKALAETFNVKSGNPQSPLGTGRVMHVILPIPHPEFDELVESAQNPGDWSLANLTPPFLKFAAHVINMASETFLSDAHERARLRSAPRSRTFSISNLFNQSHNQKSQYARNLSSMAQSFSNFGTITYPRADVDPGTAIPSSLEASAANALRQYLLERYGNNTTDDQVDDLEQNLLSHCLKFLEHRYSTEFGNTHDPSPARVLPQKTARSPEWGGHPDQPGRGTPNQGDTIGGYTVVRLIGIGGFGVVYEAYSSELKKILALKTFRDDYQDDAKVQQLFTKEANTWVDIGHHPCIVRAYLVDKVDGRLHIAMEYVAPDDHGCISLEDRLRHHPSSLTQSLRWAIHVCHGMEHAYSKGLRAHRDLKPSNILINSHGVAKIADFGLASVRDTFTESAKRRQIIGHIPPGHDGAKLEENGCGTVYYMPPEQFAGAGQCDERSDIYAFGVMLFQMVSGNNLPFLAPPPKDNSEEEMSRFWGSMYKLHREAPVPWCSSPLFAVIERCLEKAPGQRYQSFADIRSDLERLLRQQTGETIRLEDMNDVHTDDEVFAAIKSKFPEFYKSLGLGEQLEKRQWNEKGVSFHNLGRFDDAIRCFEEALKIDGEDIAALIDKGISLSCLNRYTEAIPCFNRALTIDSDCAVAFYNRALAEEEVGLPRDAVLSFKEYLRRASPDDEDGALRVRWYISAHGGD